MTEKKYIAVTQAAEALGKQKQYVFKLIDRLNVEKLIRKTSASHGQAEAHISSDDFDRIKSYLSFEVTEDDAVKIAEDAIIPGVFYLIQLEPEYDPGRVKLGFATDVYERLRSHRTSAPYSKILNTWPCKLLWEKTAIDSVTQECERLHTEVFRAQSVEDVETRCNDFFALMPRLIESKEAE